MNKAIYCVIRITTGEPVSANALTHTHTHMHTYAHRKAHACRQRNGAMLEAHGPSTKQRQPPEFAENQKR